MSYQKCPLCKGKGTIKKEMCPTCLGERILCKKTGLPPSKYVYPYSYPVFPVYPTYPTYPEYPFYHNPIITWTESVDSTGLLVEVPQVN